MRRPTLFGPMFDPANTLFGLICCAAFFYVDYKTKSIVAGLAVSIILALIFSGGRKY